MWEEWLREALTGDRKHRNELEMQKHAALLALPSVQRGGTCAALKRADTKGSFNSNLVKQCQELTFFYSL